MDIDKLKSVLAAGHPDTGPYDADSTVAAGQINLANRTVDVDSITGQQLVESTTEDDYTALNADQRQQYWGIVGMGIILVNAPNTKARILAMFGSETGTRENLAALRTRLVSHAVEEELGFVYPGHIENARM